MPPPSMPLKEIAAALTATAGKIVGTHAGVTRTGGVYDDEAVGAQVKQLFRLHTLLVAPVPVATSERLIGVCYGAAPDVAGGAELVRVLAELLCDEAWCGEWSLAWVAAVVLHQLSFHPAFPRLPAAPQAAAALVLHLKTTSAAVAAAAGRGAGCAHYPLHAALVHCLCDWAAHRPAAAMLVATPGAIATLAVAARRECVPALRAALRSALDELAAAFPQARAALARVQAPR